VIRKALWLGIWLAIGLVAVFLQIDREARRKPYLAENVPTVFRGFANAQRALAALSADQSQAAFDHAAMLVRYRPVPAEHMSLLALAAAANGRDALANRAILVSAARGWRDPVAQLVVLKGAIDAGEWEVAADRLTALWAADATGEIVEEGSQLLAASPEGRKVLAARLAQDPVWRDRYLGWAAAKLPPESSAEIITEVNRLGGHFDCGQLASIARSYFRQGDPRIAASLWSGPCASKSEDDPAGFSFARADRGDIAGPFDWILPNSGGLERTFRKSGERWVMDYESGEPIRVTLAERYARLAPGKYGLELVADGEGGPTGDELQLRVACVGLDGARSLALAVDRANTPATLEVPENGCSVQYVRILARRGDNTGLYLRVR